MKRAVVDTNVLLEAAIGSKAASGHTVDRYLARDFEFQSVRLARTDQRSVLRLVAQHSVNIVMLSLGDLHRAVQATLASKRLGAPVFVRYLLRSPEKPVAAPAQLAWIADIVRSWLGQPLDRIYAQGQSKNGHLDLTLEFRHGGTALIHWSAVSQAQATDANVMVLGNHGAAYHEGDVNYSLPPIKRGGDGAELIEVIERALRSGRPEAVENQEP